MPICLLNEQPDFQLAAWKMEEGLDEMLGSTVLSKKDLDQIESFIHGARKMEWICIRLLLQKLKRGFSIGYDANGKPFPENTPAHLSISHTRDYAGLIISDFYPVGVDFERIHPRIEKIASKFVSPAEELFIPVTHRLETLYVIWGVKEVLYKIHSIGDLLFKEHIVVEPFEFRERGEVEAAVTKPGHEKKYRLSYELRGDLLLTYCLDKS